MFRLLSLGAIDWCPKYYDPVSLGTLAVTAAGTGFGLYSQKKAQKKAAAAASATPTLLPTVVAPVERSPSILSETERQLDALRLGKGREATNLTKKKKKRSDTYLDADGGGDVVPAYTNTTLG